MPARSLTGALTLVALAGCGSDSSGRTTSSSSGATAGTRAVDVVITGEGCAPALGSYPSGPLTFKVSNKNATGVTEIELLSGERILAEKENLAPGFSGSFALQLGAGEYTLYCPGASTEKTTFKVTGGAVSQAPTDTAGLLAAGTKNVCAVRHLAAQPDDHQHPADG